MRNPLAAHPPWRQLTIIAVLLPLMITLGILAFAWPVARIGPRDLPVGIVASGPASQQVQQGLRADGFDVHSYASEASARSAMEDRDVYGAFSVTPQGVTVLTASAASPTVAQLLDTVGQKLAQHVAESVPAGQAPAGHAPAGQAKDVDVVPVSASDPRGLILSSALLPLSLCGVIMASIIVMLLGFRPAWRQILAVTIVSATAGLAALLIAQGFLGALPQDHVATWAVLALALLAIGATTAGLMDLIGPAGLGLSVILMIFIGNPFSGATSAPQLLPSAAGHIGQWLPPGAAVSLLRSTAYFHGHGAWGHVSVLLIWSILGLAAIIIGHHTPIRFAARRAMSSAPSPGSAASLASPASAALLASPGSAADSSLFSAPGRG
jgi:hypothetical protein